MIGGAATEVEMKEKKARVEALHATRAAVEEGIVAGGGVGIWCSRKLKGLKGDQDAGIKIILRALKSRAAIVANTGDEPSVVVNKVRRATTVTTPRPPVRRPREMGVVDPTSHASRCRTRHRSQA